MCKLASPLAFTSYPDFLCLQELLHYAKLCMGAYSLTAEDAVKDSEHVVKVESVAKLVSHNAEGKCPAHVSSVGHSE